MRLLVLSLLALLAPAQQVSNQDLDAVLQKADALLEQAKSEYETARDTGSAGGFVTAGFKLEEARIKYIALQEIGAPEKQKIAADRLRAVNQLGKLIHDGKVAVTGKSPDPAPAAAEPPPGAAVVVPPPPPAARVTRLALPEAGKQREAEALVRQLFKDQYAKTSPADRSLLARTLLEQAEKTADDPTAQWVLYKEATDIATQGGDLRTAMAAVESSSRIFDLDALLLKGTALAGLAKTAKTPADTAALADAQLKLAEEFMAVDQYEPAEAAATAGLQLARRGNEIALTLRATARVREVGEAKQRFKAMKAVIETLARKPDDPAANGEMGQFLCFVKGNWDLGIRFLAKGADPALKTLAEKEIAFPATALDLVNLADGWYDLGQKEKASLRKSQLIQHAAGFYQAASGSATGLLAMRVEKRLADIAKESGGPLATAPTPAPTAGAGEINLIPLIDPKVDTVHGQWSVEGGKLTCLARFQFARIQVPYLPPEEYDLTLVATRTDNIESINIGLAQGANQFQFHFDAWGGQIAGLSLLDGKLSNVNETAVRQTFFKNDQPATVVISVRKGGVAVTMDGKPVVDWKGNLSRLTNDGPWTMPNTKSLYIGCWDCRYTISRLGLTPVTGRGKKLR
jgi:hypothetical protein